MSINMILATGLNGELGQTSSSDGLPWKKNPEDMKFFRDKTIGSVVVTGGGTFRQLQDIGFENGLPARHNIVLSRSIPELDKMGYRNVYINYNKNHTCVLVNSNYLMSRLQIREISNLDSWIIGGKSIYEQFHKYCDKVYLTRINDTFPDADVVMDLSWLDEFKLVDKETLNAYSWVEIYERK